MCNVRFILTSTQKAEPHTTRFIFCLAGMASLHYHRILRLPSGYNMKAKCALVVFTSTYTSDAFP